MARPGRAIVGRVMGKDSITELRIEGLRTIERLKLPLRGLTVLIGENGSGKSSILEACEILRRAAGSRFIDELHAIHGGTFNLLRHDASELKLGVTVEGDEPSLRYDISLLQEGASTVIGGEQLLLGPDSEHSSPLLLVDRNRDKAVISHHPTGEPSAVNISGTQLVVGSAGPFAPHPAISRMNQALQQLETHLPFEVLPLWASRAYGRKSGMRENMYLQMAQRLDNLGENLVNAYHTLKTEFGEEHWQTTMDYVRLGLGDQIDGVNARVNPGGAAVALWIKLKNRDRQIPASALADGELAYLAFVALYRLPIARSLLTFDEPELHLHPGLLVRVLNFFESMAEDRPVLLATHSDRLLDALKEPAQAVHVCEVEGEARTTRIRKLDPEALKGWRAEYSGLGHIRSEGYLGMVLEEEAAE
jgi:predicted ATPase